MLFTFEGIDSQSKRSNEEWSRQINYGIERETLMVSKKMVEDST